MEVIRRDEDMHNRDHDSPITDKIFGNTDVLKIKPGFDFSSVADVSTFSFNVRSYVYKESDGDFFHQKDIELIENQVQNLDIVLLHNFATASHMLGMLIEAPLEGNHDAFMHGESQPDCLSNECILSDKTFNGNSLSYVMNANVVSRARLWFYKVASFGQSSYSQSTPYHFSIKSTKNYLDTHTKEKVACMDEIFPTIITSRRYAHKEIGGAYIIDDQYRVDSFTDVSYSGDNETNNLQSSMIVNKPSLLKVIILKEFHIFAYEIAIFKVEGTTNTLVYTASNTRKSKAEFETKDIRTSIILPEGHYTLRIRAMMKGQDFLYKTCDSVKVYVGLMPISAVKIPELANASTTFPELGVLLGTNQTYNVKLTPQTPVSTRNDKGFMNESEKLQTWSIKYLGNTADIGLYIEINENLSSEMSDDISEITATIFPDVEVQIDSNSTFSLTDVPLISTSGGKTFMFIRNLTPDKTYSIELLRQKIVKISDTLDVPSRFGLNAYLYSSSKQGEAKKAMMEIDGKKVSIPVESWVPACSESLLTSQLLKTAISNTLKSGIQYEEIVVLNEEDTKIAVISIDLDGMKDSQGSLMISVSPYDTAGGSLLEEFMITALVKGNEKQTIRSQEFEENLYMIQVDLSKSKYKDFGLRINYSINKDPTQGKSQRYDSSCNMIRLNIQYIPANKQITNKECSSGSFDTSIRSVIPSVLPEGTSSHAADEIIFYEYNTANNPQPKFKIDPFKTDHNKIKFSIKKASTFRFEIVAYPCVTSPIERTIVLNSVSKTHNKIMKSQVALGVPNYGNSVVLYVQELLPGSYELELQYGWLNNFKPKDATNTEELMDFNIEIYSLYQDAEATKLLHHKDRHIKELENMVRDMSVVNFMDRTMGEYIAQDLIVPTHPVERGAPLTIPFKITVQHAQVLVIANKNFTYIDSIEILKKESSSVIKRIHADTANSLSEILQNGEYILKFNYKDDSEREHDPVPQSITFGISNYDNIQKYKSCNKALLEK